MPLHIKGTSSMRGWLLAKIIPLGFATYLLCVGQVFALGCPDSPDQHTADIGFGGTVDFGFLKKGLKIDLDVGRYVDDVYSKYPNADKLIVIQLLASMFCEIIKDSDLSDEEKLRYFFEFSNQIKQALSISQIKDEHQEIVFEQVSRFIDPKKPTAFNLDIRVNNPSTSQIAINKLTLRFFDDKFCGGASAIRPVSATYEIIEHDGKKFIKPQEDEHAYAVTAYFPYPLSSNCFIVSGNLQQFVSANDSDRFKVIADIHKLPLPSHIRVVVELHYQIGAKRMQTEYTVELKSRT